MMMLMQENGHVSSFNAILPMLLIGDDDFSGDIDFKTLFLLSSMTQKDCSVSTAGQLNNLLPLLLMASDSNNDNSTDPLMLMLMMQTMGGQGTVQMDTLLPLMLSSDSGAVNDDLMLMIMMSAMSGGLNSQQGKYLQHQLILKFSGFDNNFNLMLPLLLGDDDSDIDTDLLVLMMAMQSQAPGTAMNTDMMLPLLLMNDGSDNQNLLFFMMMFNGKNRCEPTPTIFG
jgi:hypothetical protein